MVCGVYHARKYALLSVYFHLNIVNRSLMDNKDSSFLKFKNVQVSAFLFEVSTFVRQGIRCF